LIINLFIGIAIIFFGIGKNVQLKTFKLKNVIILYISLLLFLLFFDPLNILILLIIGFFAGGLILLNNDDNGLVKELSRLDLIWFYSLSWLFLNKTYIWFFAGFTIFLFEIYILKELTISSEFNLYIHIGLIIIFMVYHYIAIATDTFDYYSFDKVHEKLDI